MTKNTSSKSVRCVKAESVPLCLRHGYEGAALDDARWLVAFLQKAMDSIWVEGSSLTDDCRGGLCLCFDLLRDKLAIASGELPFPDIDVSDKTGAVLWNPESEQEEDE